METEKIYANAFNQVPEFGPARLRKIREYFDGFLNARKAPISEIKKAAQMKELEDFRRKIDPDKEFAAESKIC